MDTQARRAHWDTVYTTKAEDEVSWFQDEPAPSLRMIRAAGLATDAAIIDVGGGASRLVDALIADGHSALTVLDLSAQALARTRARLGDRAAGVEWITADVTSWQPDATYALWHDRAAFHFLTEPADRAAYAARVHLRAGRAGALQRPADRAARRGLPRRNPGGRLRARRNRD